MRANGTWKAACGRVGRRQGHWIAPWRRGFRNIDIRLWCRPQNLVPFLTVYMFVYVIAHPDKKDPRVLAPTISGWKEKESTPIIHIGQKVRRRERLAATTRPTKTRRARLEVKMDRTGEFSLVESCWIFLDSIRSQNESEQVSKIFNPNVIFNKTTDKGSIKWDGHGFPAVPQDLKSKHQWSDHFIDIQERYYKVVSLCWCMKVPGFQIQSWCKNNNKPIS